MTLIAFTYSTVAVTYGVLGAALVMLRRPKPMPVAALLTSVWAISIIKWPQFQDILWFLQEAGWVAVVGAFQRHFGATLVEIKPNGRHDVRLQTATRIVVGCGILASVFAALGTRYQWLQTGGGIIEARLFMALAALILIENVYRNAPEEVRWHINLPLIAIATTAIFTFVLYGDAIIHKHLSPNMLDAQAIVYLIVLPLFVGTERRMRRWRQRIAISHGAAFYTGTLILGGSVLVGLGLTGTFLRHYGKNWGSVIEIALIFFGIVVLLVLVSSGSARSRLRRLIADNFFAQRYDYRREWLRCIETLAAIEQGGLPQRVIKVLADTIDSPSGILMLRDDAQESLLLATAGEWNMRGPAVTLDANHPLMIRLAADGYYQVLKEPNQPLIDPLMITTTPPSWLAFSLPDPRSSAPLGVVLLSAPRSGDTLNEESVALLRVVAGEISLMVAERRAAESLAEARRFAAAGQRFAFVAHDIKNVANQLALLVSNADQHIDDPDFRDDMMATLRGSVGKIQSMLTRLKSSEVVPAAPLDIADRLRAMSGAWSRERIAVVLDIDDRVGAIAMEPAAFDAVMNHLVDNAIEASNPGQIISVGAASNSTSVILTITDRGAGMSEQFIRDQLFRPFSSSKSSGFGLGAFQARELVHAAGGTVTIASEINRGTVVRLSFPVLAPTSHDEKLVVV